MIALHYITAPDGSRYPYEEGALDGLTSETREQTAIALASDNYGRGNTAYIITRADVMRQLGRAS